MIRIRTAIGRVASLAKSGSSLGHFSSSCAGLATALLLALSASGTSAAESPRYHHLGFAPQIAVIEKSRGAYEHDLYHRGVPDLGLKLFYKCEATQSFVLGLEIEGRTLGIGDDLNLAIDHRYAALLEWSFGTSAIWPPATHHPRSTPRRPGATHATPAVTPARSPPSTNRRAQRPGPGSAGRAAGGRPYVQETVSANHGNQGVGRVKAHHTVTCMVRWADVSS
jgi:hypothetical protein